VADGVLSVDQGVWRDGVRLVGNGCYCVVHSVPEAREAVAAARALPAVNPHARDQKATPVRTCQEKSRSVTSRR
jgi:hypothetical protein